MKVVKKLELDQIYEIDGGFYYVVKDNITTSRGVKYSRLFLKTVASHKKMSLLMGYIQSDVKEVKGEE